MIYRDEARKVLELSYLPALIANVVLSKTTQKPEGRNGWSCSVDWSSFREMALSGMPSALCCVYLKVILPELGQDTLKIPCDCMEAGELSLVTERNPKETYPGLLCLSSCVWVAAAIST